MKMTSASQTLAKLISITILMSAAVAAQPMIDSVRDLASKVPPGFPFYSLAPGGFIEIHGSGLGPDQRVEDYPSFPLGQTLAGTSVEVTVEDTTVNALLASTSGREIKAVLPTGTPFGSGQLRVTYNGETSDPVDVTVANSVGIFTQNGRGNGPALAINADFEPISTINPAHPGEIIMVLLSANGVSTSNPAAASPPATARTMDFEDLKKKMKAGDPKAFRKASDGPQLGVAVHFGEDMQTPPLMYGSLFPGISYVILQVPNILGCWVPFYIEGASALGVYHSSYAQLAIALLQDLVCRDLYGVSYEKLLKVRQSFIDSGKFQVAKDLRPYLTLVDLIVAHVLRGEIYGGYPSFLFPELHFYFAALDKKLKSYVHLGEASNGTQVLYSRLPTTTTTGKHQPNFYDFGSSVTLQGNEPSMLTRQSDGSYSHSQNYLSNVAKDLTLDLSYMSQTYNLNVDMGVQNPGESPDIDKLTPYPVDATNDLQFNILGTLPQGFRYHVELTTCLVNGYCATLIKITTSPNITFTSWQLGHLPSSQNARLSIIIESAQSGTISGFPSENTVIPRIRSSGASILDGIELNNPQLWQVGAF